MKFQEVDIDKQLVESALNNDRSAFKKLYDSYSGVLSTLCYRYIPDNAEADDVLQESLVKIFTSLDKFQYRGKGSLRAWMSRIVVNNALKHLRDNKKWQNVELTDRVPDVADETEDDSDFADVPQEVIMDFIRRLPEGYRSVFNLYVFEEKSHKEIAGILDIRESTSASQFHRAKALLAKWIDDYRTGKLENK
ncbi:MAG: RNA polymerase sigma factor [Bacteroidales bacterium]